MFSLSRQIRPPIYSLKQSKLRKRRVVRYAILYFSMFVLFFILIIGPVIANKFGVFKDFGTSTFKGLEGGSFALLQPTNWYNNDTRNHTVTGYALTGKGSGAPGAGSTQTTTAGGGGGGGGAKSTSDKTSAFPTGLFGGGGKRFATPTAEYLHHLASPVAVRLH